MALSGDIKLNPVPARNVRNNTPKCSLCKKEVGTTRKLLQCSQYRNLTHITCSNIPRTELPHYTAQTVYAWLCSDDSDYNIPLSQNEHRQKLNEHSKHTSIAHLNIQAIISTFNEFVMMLQEYQFDIVALSETWLQDCSFQQNYVQVNVYNSFFRNRIGKRGGGVGFYIKESITYKVRHELSKRHDNLEYYLLKLVREIKIHPSLICAACQPSSNEIEKLKWLENFKNLLADVY